MKNYQRIIIDKLIPYAKANNKIRLIISDMGFSAIDNFRKEVPEQLLNSGIMEQGMVGICAGMAISGLLPIYYSVSNFLVFRALEQIRNDIVLQNLNVKLIGIGANDYYKFLGSSHCCGEDDIKLMDIIGMKVYNPYSDNTEFDEIIKEWLESEEAGYIRV